MQLHDPSVIQPAIWSRRGLADQARRQPDARMRTIPRSSPMLAVSLAGILQQQSRARRSIYRRAAPADACERNAEDRDGETPRATQAVRVAIQDDNSTTAALN